MVDNIQFDNLATAGPTVESDFFEHGLSLLIAPSLAALSIYLRVAVNLALHEYFDHVFVSIQNEVLLIVRTELKLDFLNDKLLIE